MAASKARLRHIAISVADVAAAQKFFEDAFGMTKAGDAGRGVFMTDGTINVRPVRRRLERRRQGSQTGRLTAATLAGAARGSL